MTGWAGRPHLTHLPSSIYPRTRVFQDAFDLAGQFLDVDRPRDYPNLLFVEEPFLYGRERENGHTYPLALPPQCGEALLAAPVDKVRGYQEKIHSLHQV